MGRSGVASGHWRPCYHSPLPMVGGGGGAWGGHFSPICDFLGDLCFAQTKAENPDLGHAAQVVCHLLTVDRVAVWVEFRIWCKNILLLFSMY